MIEVKIYFAPNSVGVVPKPMDFKCNDICHMVSGTICFEGCLDRVTNGRDLYLPSSHISMMIVKDEE